MILAGRGGPALLAVEPGAGEHLAVVILAGRGGPALPRLPSAPETPAEPGVVILAGRGGPALPARSRRSYAG